MHKRKRLSKQQKEVAREITNIVIANEDPPNWLAKAGRYAAEPTDRNHERVKKVQDVAYEHQVDDFLAEYYTQAFMKGKSNGTATRNLQLSGFVRRTCAGN